MKELALVFLGGGIGSVLRYGCTLLAAHAPAVARSPFPWATFGVNVAGSLAIGALSALAARGLLAGEMRLLLVVGLCGGFTTFSTFSNEGLALLRAGHGLPFALYATGSIAAGVAAALAGWKMCG